MLNQLKQDLISRDTNCTTHEMMLESVVNSEVRDIFLDDPKFSAVIVPDNDAKIEKELESVPEFDETELTPKELKELEAMAESVEEYDPDDCDEECDDDELNSIIEACKESTIKNIGGYAKGTGKVLLSVGVCNEFLKKGKLIDMFTKLVNGAKTQSELKAYKDFATGYLAGADYNECCSLFPSVRKNATEFKEWFNSEFAKKYDKKYKELEQKENK